MPKTESKYTRKGTGGTALVQGGGPENSGSLSPARLDSGTLPNLCFRCILFLLISLLVIRIAVNISTCVWIPELRGKAWFFSCFSTCLLGSLSLPPDGEPPLNPVPRLCSSHSIPSLHGPLFASASTLTSVCWILPPELYSYEDEIIC